MRTFKITETPTALDTYAGDVEAIAAGWEGDTFVILADTTSHDGLSIPVRLTIDAARLDNLRHDIGAARASSGPVRCKNNGTGPRSDVRDHAPICRGHGSTRTWTRTLRGVPHGFTAVLMPDGERRYAVNRYNGYGDDGTAEGRASGMRFGCAWSPVAFWTVKP